MRRTWTIIGVGDVPGSFKWYQSLFGLPETAPAHDDFGQILAAKGTRSRRPVRGGAPRESEHWNCGDLTSRSGRVLRHDQCAFCSLRLDNRRVSSAQNLPSARNARAISICYSPSKVHSEPAVHVRPMTPPSTSRIASFRRSLLRIHGVNFDAGCAG
jgi:hypothetical protein